MKNNIKNIKNNKYSIIDFWAKWCSPCLLMKKIINKIKIYYKNKIIIYKINIDKYKKLMNEYNIQSIPTLVFLKYGKEIDRNIGIISKDDLINKCNILFKLN
ncbi:MAG: thioredoxin family protein [Candidatus Shikimatogenerans bostrichidophilus]|nr:MAG: thioredoxin family protein [Candidatus Shikimatogenerans bostrichidophilus]